MTNIGIRLSLMEYLPVKYNGMIIDEGFTKMDNDNRLSVATDLFNRMREIFDYVIIISHLDELKYSCDESIEITKDRFGNSIISNA